MKSVRLALATTLLGGALLAAPGEFPLSSAYIAPANQIFYRLRYEDGFYREFQRSIEMPHVMLSTDGWKGVFDGSYIVVQGPAKNGAIPHTRVFLNGRITRVVAPGYTNNIPYNTARIAPKGVAPPYFFGTRLETFALGEKRAKKNAQNIQENLFKNKWDTNARLSWPFMNPNENGALFACFAILAFAFLLNGERPLRKLAGIGFLPDGLKRFLSSVVFTVIVKVVGAVLFVVFSGLLFLTFSRGAFLGGFVGCLAVAAFGFRSFKDKITLIVLIAVASVLLIGTGSIVYNRGVDNMKKVLFRGCRGKSTWSNQVRYDMWNAAPRMMLDAPHGWKGVNVGRAYLDWYEDVDMLTAPGSLMNDHLTRMTRYGWTGRSAYVCTWFVLHSALARWAVTKGNEGAVGG